MYIIVPKKKTKMALKSAVFKFTQTNPTFSAGFYWTTRYTRNHAWKLTLI